jgi:hypothetical protein
MTTTAASFPLSKHTGGGETAPTFSGQCVYMQFMGEVGLPPSPVEFSSHHHFYKVSCYSLLGRCHHSCLCQPACLFTVLEGISLSPSLALRATHPLCYVSFFVVIAYYSVFFSFFPWVGVGLSRGLC